MGAPAWLAWCLAPLSGAADHHLPAWALWHGRLMVLAWAVLLPLGALAARYFKVWPGQPWPQVLDNPRWWRLHIRLQAAGAVAMGIGVVLAWGQAAGATPVARAHALAGWLLLGAGAVQVAGGLLRGSKGGPTKPAPDGSLHGDHFDMTPRRVAFERLHKAIGWLAVGGAIGVIGLGLVAADAPRWMLALLAGWWWLLLLLAARWQRQGRCLDTYQAIWGPGPALPGNQRRPIGWGVRRVPQDGR